MIKDSGLKRWIKTDSRRSELMAIAKAPRCAFSNSVYLHDGLSHSDRTAQGHRFSVCSCGILHSCLKAFSVFWNNSSHRGRRRKVRWETQNHKSGAEWTGRDHWLSLLQTFQIVLNVHCVSRVCVRMHNVRRRNKKSGSCMTAKVTVFSAL